MAGDMAARSAMLMPNQKLMLMLTTVTEEELLVITEVAALTLAALSGALEESVTQMPMPTLVMVVMAVVLLDITEAVLLMLDLPSGVLEERSVMLMPMLTLVMAVMVVVLLHITEVVLLMLDLPYGDSAERSVMPMLNQKPMLMLTTAMEEELLVITEVAALTLAVLSGALEESDPLKLMVDTDSAITPCLATHSFQDLE